MSARQRPRLVGVRGGAVSARQRPRLVGVRGGIVAVALAAALAAGCAAGDDVLPAAAPAEEPGLAHVHGLGVDPGDDRVYVATHFGLWRLDGAGEAERVGGYHYDLMGFTVVGDNHFVASGHPLTEELPPLLGLIETTDAGRTWRSVSLLGSADFHALRAAHGRVYGWNSSDGAFLVSADHEHWQRRSQVPALLDFVVDPQEPDHVLASVPTSLDDIELLRSDDGGREWTPVDGPPAVRLAWSRADRLWGVDPEGRVWRSTDAGRSWEETGRAAGRAEALLDTGDTLILAGGGVIAESPDGGRRWDELFREEQD